MRCDSHIHIVGPFEQYPQTERRTYLALPALLPDLQKLGAERGISRFVVVQPSFYGTDNRATLDALDRLGGNGRGVAVVDPDKATRAELENFARRGIRGLRINLYSRLEGPAKLDEVFDAVARLASGMNWHVEVIAGLPMLAANADLLARSPAPIVIDHYGVYGTDRPDSGNARKLLELLKRPHVWMKLSGTYRVGADPSETRPDPEWIAAILAAAADRCVWGSDWPHTPPHGEQKGPDVPGRYRNLSYARVVDDFRAALPSKEIVERILADNPARLYDFSNV